MLRAILVISLVIVQLSMASTEKVGKWLQERALVNPDEEDIREPENLTKEIAVPAILETANAVQHTALLDISHATT